MFAPRGIPHSHKRVVPRTGRFLTLTSPAGFEGFLRELSEAEARGAAMTKACPGVTEIWDPLAERGRFGTVTFDRRTCLA